MMQTYFGGCLIRDIDIRVGWSANLTKSADVSVREV